MSWFTSVFPQAVYAVDPPSPGAGPSAATHAALSISARGAPGVRARRSTSPPHAAHGRRRARDAPHARAARGARPEPASDAASQGGLIARGTIPAVRRILAPLTLLLIARA